MVYARQVRLHLPGIVCEKSALNQDSITPGSLENTQRLPGIIFDLRHFVGGGLLDAPMGNPAIDVGVRLATPRNTAA